MIHAGWAHKDPSNLSLFDAAHTDTRDSVLLAVELKSIQQGISKGGTGPSYEERKTKLHRRELGRAAQLGQELMQIASENGLLVDPNSGHRPPENKTTHKRKQHKRTEAQSTDVQALPGTSSSSLQQQILTKSGCSLEPTQRSDRATAQQTTPAFASVQSNAVHHSNSMALNQLRCLPTTSHQMEQPAAVIMGRSYHGVSPQDVLHHHPPVMAGGLSVQQHRTKLSAANIHLRC